MSTHIESMEHAQRAWLTMFTEPGFAEARKVFDREGPQQAVETYGQFVTERLRFQPHVMQEFIDKWAARGIIFLSPESEAWPTQLDDLEVPPLGLWVLGEVDALGMTNRHPTCAMVGARASTSYGDHMAGVFAAELTERDVMVISGMAYGIDAASHRGALSVDKVPTLAVMAGGLERVYPTGHKELAERIAEKGCLISEVAPGMTPTRNRFLQRNRLIAALGDGMVVVEAGWRSGSLNAARHARELRRSVGAVPGPITSAASTGCHMLIRDEGAALITTTPQILEMIGVE